MLEFPEQRIKLLKAGFYGKEIEMLYIEQNNFKIVHNIFYGAAEFDVHQNKSFFINPEVVVECGRSIFENNRKTISISILSLVALILALFVSISTLFFTLVLALLFVPPILALVTILKKEYP